MIGTIKIDVLNSHSCAVYRKSFFTDGWASMILPVSATRVHDFISNPDAPLIQKAFPELTIDQREFILTGMDGPTWNE